jgi:hypothetical protein
MELKSYLDEFEFEAMKKMMEMHPHMKADLEVYSSYKSAFDLFLDLPKFSKLVSHNTYGDIRNSFCKKFTFIHSSGLFYKEVQS